MLDEELDPLDNLIGSVAKAMTDAPADADLARRVSMRIAEARERRPRWLRPWVLVPMAAACVLVLAVVVARDKSATVVRVEQAPAVGRPFQGRQGGAESPAPQRAVARTPQPLAELPTTTIAPIEVDRLTVQPIVEVSAIDINPIGIDRIEISAMP